MRWGAALGIAVGAHAVVWCAVDRVPARALGVVTEQDVVWLDPPPPAPERVPVSATSRGGEARAAGETVDRMASAPRSAVHTPSRPRAAATLAAVHAPDPMPSSDGTNTRTNTRSASSDSTSDGPDGLGKSGGASSGGSGSAGGASGGGGNALAAPLPTVPKLVHGARLLTHDPCRGYFPYRAPGAAGNASLEVIVDAGGHPTTARIVNEEPSAQGFGQAALACAHTLTFAPAVDSTGHPTTQATRMKLTFTRMR